MSTNARSRKKNGSFIRVKKAQRIEKTSDVLKNYNASVGENHHEPVTSCDHVDHGDTENASTVLDIQWKDGRRIVELDILAHNLFCKDCGGPLLLSDTECEKRLGLASILYITCKCGSLNSVPTGKSHRSGSRGLPIYDVNTKAAAGMLHCGMGATHVANWLSTVNIPPLSASTIKRREREIGPVIEDVAQGSCDSSFREEMLLSTMGGLDSDRMQNESPIEMTASYDMGWQRRSSGRSYNSKSGHGCWIGEKTGNIIAYGTKKSACRMCEQSIGTKVVEHDCRYNWSGTAKAMESGLGVELLQKTHHSNGAVKRIVMDDDATTLAHIRKEFDPHIVKWSDINHAKKSLTNALYALAKKHKRLSSKVISYLKKCYSYVLSQNKGNAENVRQGLRNIVSHVFGQHDMCGSWCGYKRLGENYHYKSLPRGQPLSGDQFREDLQHVFEIHALNADRLAPLGSTKSNESFNNVVASKAPKNRHYSSSESLDFRVGSAVSQKNIGPGYMSTVFEKKGLSPGKALLKRSQALKRKYAKRKTKALTKEFKRRRVILAENRNRFNEEHEVREGTSYATNISAISGDDINVTKIPDPVCLPQCTPLDAEVVKHSALIVFDIETCSTEFNTDICQISAVAVDDELDVFNAYILPEQPISSFASNVTELTVHENTLLYKGQPVTTVSKECALKDFIAWLQRHNQVILVGHNVKSFDSVHLLTAAADCSVLDDLMSVVTGFMDTLPHFRELFPDMSCHKETYLVEKLLHKTYEAHNSLEDCLALRELVRLNSHNISKHSFSMEWAKSHMVSLKNKHLHLRTYSVAIRRKIISQTMAAKCASSGLEFQHLHLAYQRNKDDGLRALLGEKTRGKVRITQRKSVVDKLSSHFKNLYEVSEQ